MSHLAEVPDPFRKVSAVDMLIAGDVMRIVLDGTPALSAGSAAEALEELRSDHQAFRHFVISWPRGHEHINACLLLAPFSSDAIRTAIVAEHFGYAPVAGTPLIAAAVALAETGQVPIAGPETAIVFDTAQGKEHLTILIDDERRLAARWTTQRPRIVVPSVEFALQDGRTVAATVVSPGLPFLVAFAADFGISFDDPSSIGVAGALLGRAAEQQLSPQAVGLERELDKYLVMIVGELVDRGPDVPASVQVACVSSTGEISRMPTGTGALSVGTVLDETGQLAPGRWLDATTPTGHMLRTRIEKAQASVEGAADIIARVELVEKQTSKGNPRP